MDENSDRHWRLCRLVFSAFGLLPLTFGFAIVLYIYAFAGMVNPRLADDERRALIFRKMFLNESSVPVLFGLVLIVVGACVLFSGVAAFFPGKLRSRAISRSAITLLAIALVLIALLLLALA